MYLDTTIYGEVFLPLEPAGAGDLSTLRQQFPRLRVQVMREDKLFVVPLQSLILGVYTPRPLDLKRIRKLSFM